MTHVAEPFYFLSEGQEIFALYHPPQGIARGEGIVICYPAPQEIMRSYQAHVQLARILAEQGYAVLRFDYAGTGDSEGKSDEVSLKVWEANLIQAMSILKQRSHASRLSLLGTRLGATLALRASRRVGVKQLIFWDPVFDGVTYVRELEEAHLGMLTRDPVDPPHLSPEYLTPQCVGFPWTPCFREELAAVSPVELETYCRHMLFIQSEPHPTWDRYVRTFTQLGIHVDHSVVNEPMHWTDDRYMKIRAFPTKTLRTISQLLGGNT
jgi:hypothetical protein